MGFWFGAEGPHLGPGSPPLEHDLPLCHTLDGGLGLAAEVTCGADGAAGAGRAGCHPHAQPFQVPKAVGECLGLVLQLLPVSCRAWGPLSSWLPRVSDMSCSAGQFSLRFNLRPLQGEPLGHDQPPF